MEGVLMLKRVLILALVFAGVGAAYGIVKSLVLGDHVVVDWGLVITLAATGAIGGVIQHRQSVRGRPREDSE